MPGGKDAKTLRGKSPNSVGPGNYGRRPSPSYPAKSATMFKTPLKASSGPGASREVSRPPDEVDRVAPGRETSAANRHDHFGSAGRSGSTGGPPPQAGSRKPRSYQDQ